MLAFMQGIHRFRAFFGGDSMGHSKAEKAKTHKRIVAIASKRFREEGLAGVGIAELMKEAGLTIGGFYKHFDSRDDLVAEAVSAAFGGWQRRVERAASRDASRTFIRLSPRQQLSCPYAGRSWHVNPKRSVAARMSVWV